LVPSISVVIFSPTYRLLLLSKSISLSLSLSLFPSLYLDSLSVLAQATDVQHIAGKRLRVGDVKHNVFADLKKQ
jgi:hypothetical protein